MKHNPNHGKVEGHKTVRRQYSNYVRRNEVKNKLFLAGCSLSLCITASATQLFVNGGFESGDLSGWTVTNDASAQASLGSFYIDDTNGTPLTGNPTVGPHSGDFYAVSDDIGPGIMALSQTFLDPIGTTSAILSFNVFVNDFFGNSGGVGRVDLLAGGSDPITGAVLATFFGPADTNVVGGLPNTWVAFSLDIAANMTPGQSYQIRIMDNESNGGPIYVGADDFSLDATGNTAATPEPAMFLPVGLVAGFLFYRSRQKAHVRA
jgi:hypothetical protein